jgi:hypothetical protein
MKRKHKITMAIFIFLVSLTLAVFAGGVYAEDCPCDPCPGGAYGCENGCISICWPDTNKCTAKCTKAKTLEFLPDMKLNKGDTFRRVYLNNVPSESVKPIFEQLFGVKLVVKSKAKTDFIKIKSDNVNLDGILQALKKEGLVLQIK